MPDHSEPDALGAEVINIIAKTQRIPLETITLDSTFDQLKIDSLDGINLVFALEDQFGINIPDDSVQTLRTVRQTVDGVKMLIAQKAQSASGAS